MRYLITGGCGFLGSNIVNALLQRKETVLIFDNLSHPGAAINLNWLKNQGDFDFIHGDIAKAHKCDEVIKNYKPDVIFHFAGQVAMTSSLRDPRSDFEVNALGTFNILNAIRQYSENTFLIYSSTNKVYGDLNYLEYQELETRFSVVGYPNGLPETLPLDFHSPYGCSKGAADQYVLDFSRMYGLRTSVFRHSSMYGEHQHGTSDQGWISWFCQQAVHQIKDSRAEFTVSGNGKQVRDILHNQDMITLYLKAVENAHNLVGQAFNIGGGNANSLSIIELLELISDICSVKLNYKFVPKRQSDQIYFVADIKKISSLIDWAPSVKPKFGITQIIRNLM